MYEIKGITLKHIIIVEKAKKLKIINYFENYYKYIYLF